MNCARRALEARVAGLVPAGSLRGGRMPVNREVNARDGRMPVNREVNARSGRMPVNRAVSARSGRMPVNRAVSARVPAGKTVMREVAGRSLRKAEVNARPREKIPRAAAVRRLRKDNKFFLRRQIALAGHCTGLPTVC